MNTYFGRHAIVTISASGSFITLRTLDALHGRTTRMFVGADALYNWIDTPSSTSFMDYDCGSFIVMHRVNDQTVHVHQTWIQPGIRNTIRGYTQDFDLAVDDLLAALVAEFGIKRLVDLDSRQGQASVTITNGAHRQIKALDKLHRRALSKAMRDNFRWKDSHVCLYADWDKDFSFVDQRMNGGLCLHETHVIGRDGKFHRKLHYQVHT